jgi:lipopolysaccharide export system protein LptA
VTTGLSFDQNTGIASTDQEVRFWFAQGQGSARGAAYDPQSQQLTLRSAVQIALQDVGIQPQRTQSGEPGPTSVQESRSASPGDNDAVTRIRAANLRFQQGQSSIHLGGPVELTRDTRSIQAGDTEIQLDERRQARRIRLDGGLTSVDRSPGRTSEVRARRGLLDLSDQGKPQLLDLRGDIGWSSSASGASRQEGRAQQAELSFTPAGLLSGIVADQDARVVLRDAPASSPVSGGKPRSSQGPALGVGTQTLAAQQIEVVMAPDGQTVRQVVARSRPTLELVPFSPSEEQWQVEGEAFEMAFDAAGNLTQFAAERNVRVHVGSPSKSSWRRVSTSDHLTARLDPRARSIARIEQTGRYRYQDAEKQARADRAEYSAEGEMIVLRGEAVVWNATGKLVADQIALDNVTGNLQAEGKVSTTHTPPPQSGTSDSLPIHAVAERMRYDSTAGKAEYQGHVRLWQGSRLLEAGWVALDRRQKQLEARGKVYSVFNQPPPGLAKGSAQDRSAQPEGTEPTEIRSEHLLYQENEHRAMYRVGVRMRSASATVHSGELEIFLGPAAAGATVTESGRIERAVATREVVIQDSGRRATADRAEYFPEDARVQLLGKPATVADPQRGSTQGVRLTYRMGDDRIFVEGEPGLPAETRRQVHR